MTIRPFLLLFWVVLWTLSTAPLHAQTTLKISGIKGSINHQIGSAILKKAYDGIGIKITTVAYPAKRSLVMANAGEFDGEVQRIAAISEHYPNLVAVPEPLLYLESSVFVKDPSIQINAWEDLSHHLIGIPRGIIYLEKHTQSMNRLFLKSTDQLFHMLNTKRIDVVIISTNYGRSFLSRHPEMDIRMIEPPILRIPLYHFLHRKHQSLVPKITEAIKKMKHSGKLGQIVTSYTPKN